MGTWLVVQELDISLWMLNLEVGQTRKIPKRFSRGRGGAAGLTLRWPEESALSGRGVGRKRDGTTEGFRDEYFLVGRLWASELLHYNYLLEYQRVSAYTARSLLNTS